MSLQVLETIPSKPSVLILSGLPAAGKSTYAKAWVAEDPQHRRRINYDDLRLEMFGPLWVFNHGDERRMKKTAQSLGRQYLEAGYSIVVDNTNLTGHARGPWENLAREFGIEPELYEIPATIEECVLRDSKREGNDRVGRAVIERFALFNGFIDWPDTKYAIFDVDGTLADCNHRRHFLEKKPKDWDGFFSECHNDPPIRSIVELAKSLKYAAYTVLIVSGRGIDKAGITTEDWLDKHIPNVYSYLFMRNSNDHRPDTEVKMELLELLPKDKIEIVVDDRDSVVAAWRQAGLTCLQAAPGNF